MTTTGKLLTLGIAVLLGFSVCKYYPSDPPGYCRELKRFPSDDELLKGLFQSMKDKDMKHDGSEQSLDTYRAAHPGCCGVSRGSNTQLQVDDEQMVLVIVYELSDDSSSRKSGKYYQQYKIVDSCGRKVMSFGTTTNTPPISSK